MKYLDIPIVIEIVLYRYNYIDNRIINLIQKECNILGSGLSDETTLAVTKVEFLKVFNNKFKDEIKELERQYAINPNTTLNSIYFIKAILDLLPNLEVVKFVMSNDKNYSRVYELNNQKVTGVNYLISTIEINFPKYLNSKNLRLFNELLQDIKLSSTFLQNPYYILRCSDFISRLSTINENKYKEILDLIDEIIIDKVRLDDPILTINTEYEYV